MFVSVYVHKLMKREAIGLHTAEKYSLFGVFLPYIYTRYLGFQHFRLNSCIILGVALFLIDATVFSDLSEVQATKTTYTNIRSRLKEELLRRAAKQLRSF